MPESAERAPGLSGPEVEMWWLVATAGAGVGEIRTLAVQEGGLFLAVCQDGSEERVTAADIRADRVCGRPAGMVCVSEGGSWARLTRLSDNKPLGSSIDAQICQEIARAAHTTVCVPEGGPWGRLTAVADLRPLGSSVLLSDCLPVTRRSSALTCVPQGGSWARLARVDSGSPMGSALSLTDCVASLP
jgi:hypothetical protein